MSAEVSFNMIVITDLEENFREVVARSEGKEDKKIWRAANKKRVENALRVTQSPSV